MVTRAIHVNGPKPYVPLLGWRDGDDPHSYGLWCIAGQDLERDVLVVVAEGTATIAPDGFEFPADGEEFGSTTAAASAGNRLFVITHGRAYALWSMV